jgi:hypothetical protein
MKMKITALCLTFILVITSFNLQAKIFYVVSGDSFELKPSLTTLFQYKWMEGGIDVPASEILTGGTLRKTFTLASSTVAETKTISLGVLDVSGGCLSDLINHTVVVLPKLTLAVVPLVDSFCENLTAITTEITASLPAILPDLTTYGVTLGSTYKWFKDGVLIPDATGNKITVTDIGVYKSEVAYILPTIGSYIPNGSKIVDAIIGSATILKDKDAPTTPDIEIL